MSFKRCIPLSGLSRLALPQSEDDNKIEIIKQVPNKIKKKAGGCITSIRVGSSLRHWLRLCYHYKNQISTWIDWINWLNQIHQINVKKSDNLTSEWIVIGHIISLTKFLFQIFESTEVPYFHKRMYIVQRWIFFNHFLLTCGSLTLS